MSWLERIRRQKLPTLSLLVFTLCSVIVMGSLLTQGLHAARGQAAVSDATPLTIPPIHKLDNEFVKIAKAIEPSVVYISTDWKPKQVSNKKRGAPQGDDQGDDDMDLFHRFFGEQGPMQQPPNSKQEASGSGFIVDRNGYILTNLHVICLLYTSRCV